MSIQELIDVVKPPKFFWLTDGQPEKWPIIAQRDEEYQQFDFSMTMFLAGMFDNKIKSPMWKEPFKKSHRTFTPEKP